MITSKVEAMPGFTHNLAEEDKPIMIFIHLLKEFDIFDKGEDTSYFVSLKEMHRKIRMRRAFNEWNKVRVK